MVEVTLLLSRLCCGSVGYLLSLPFTAPTIRGFLHQVLEGETNIIMEEYSDLATMLGVTAHKGRKEATSSIDSEGRVEVKRDLHAVITYKYEELSHTFEFSETNPLKEFDFKEPEPLQVSTKKEVSSLKFTCKMCPQKFLTESKLRDHIEQCHKYYKNPHTAYKSAGLHFSFII